MLENWRGQEDNAKLRNCEWKSDQLLGAGRCTMCLRHTGWSESCWCRGCCGRSWWRVYNWAKDYNWSKIRSAWFKLSLLIYHLHLWLWPIPQYVCLSWGTHCPYFASANIGRDRFAHAVIARLPVATDQLIQQSSVLLGVCGNFWSFHHHGPFQSITQNKLDNERVKEDFRIFWMRSWVSREVNWNQVRSTSPHHMALSCWGKQDWRRQCSIFIRKFSFDCWTIARKGVLGTC